MKCILPSLLTEPLLDRYANHAALPPSLSYPSPPIPSYPPPLSAWFQVIIACCKGGTSIEDLAEHHPDLIVKVPVDIFAGISEEQALAVADGLAPQKADRKAVADQVTKLYNLFAQSDCTLVEVRTPAGNTGLSQK